jgi:TPR repeat protein
MNIQNLCLNCFAERRPESACSDCGWRGETKIEFEGQLLSGSVLQNRYVVGRPLGRGGFSITYCGWDTRLQRLRAIKEYFPAGVVTREGSQSRISIVAGQGGLYSDGIHKYLAEARLLARFEGNPCIVFPTDFFEENATAYLVMEYLKGETLRQYVTRNGGRIPFAHAVFYLKPVVDALSAVHAEGMLHRDVSPDNVFLTVGNETKLLDFGAARQRMGGQSAAMTVIIRDHYAPPEQYSEKGEQGTWTDIYAFAATFYFALTGESPPSALSRLMNDELRRPSELGASLPLAAEAMLMRALSIQPRERPHEIEEVLHALLAPPQPIAARVEAATAPADPAPAPTPAVELTVEELVEPSEPVAPVVPVQVADALEATPVAPEAPAVMHPSARERIASARAGVLRLLQTAREEQRWRWPVFAVVAAAVALATYAVLERVSPGGSAPKPTVSAPPVPADETVAAAEPAPVLPEIAGGAVAPPDLESPSPVASPGPVAIPEPVVSPAVELGSTSAVAPAQPLKEEDPAPVAPVAATPAKPKPPPTPAAKPAVPPSTAPVAGATAPAPAPPRNEFVRTYEEGRELVRSTKRSDRKRGYELVAHAANGGLPAAELLLGSLYVEGIPGIQKPDEASALKWYRAAAKHGDAKARYDLARRLELGIWEKKVQYVKDCAWWVPFCRADLPEAQVELDVDPEKDLVAWLRSQSPGKGTSAELKEALALYKGLADQGNTDAQERIGFMLVAGNGIEPDRSEAFLAFLKAARKGDSSAQYVVGKMYAKGEGIAPNDDAAVCWLRKAAASNIPSARQALVAMGKAKPTGDLEPAPRECRFKSFDE